MMNLFQRFTRHPSALIAILAATSLCTTAAQAGTITIGATGVAAPAHTENFNIGALGNNVSTQFAANGLTMTTLSGAGVALVSNATCNNSSQGVDGQYLYMGVTTPCNYSSGMIDAVSIKFNGLVSELSWTGFSRANNDGFTISALLAGAVVSSIDFNAANQFENQTVLFTGSTFDELRFVEKGPGEYFFALDNMAWNAAAAVPEPASFALFGLGLALVAAGRRRKA
jgi:hypothetical protein